MSDAFVLQNTGHGQIAFMLYPPVELDMSLPKHKRRKTLRGGMVSIVIPQGGSVDLVDKTGLPASTLRKLPEVLAIMNNKNVRVAAYVSEDPKVPSSVAKFVAPEPPAPPPPAAPVKAPEQVVAPPVVAEPAPAPEPEPEPEPEAPAPVEEPSAVPSPMAMPAGLPPGVVAPETEQASHATKGRKKNVAKEAPKP